MAKFAVLALIVGACGVASGLAGETHAGSSDEFRYHYVSLNDTLPQEFVDSGSGFYPIKVTPRRVVYGTAYACTDPVNFTGCYNAVLAWRDGQLQVLYRGPFIAYAANDFGVFAGAVVVDSNYYIRRAALLAGGRLTVLDPLPGEYESYMSRITNTGIALAESYPVTGFLATYRLRWLGWTVPITAELINNEAPHPYPPSPHLNDFGQVGGSALMPGRPEDSIFYSRAVRVAPPRGPTTFLEPVGPNQYSEGTAINNRGDVLGYSIPNDTRPRGTQIGVWRGTKFQSYYTLGDSPPGSAGPNEYSIGLLWNEPSLIISIGLSYSGGRTFLLPKPGVRIDLNNVVENRPDNVQLVTDLNNAGDMVGYLNDYVNGFLLERVDPRDVRQRRVDQSASVRTALPVRHPTRTPFATELRLRDHLLKMLAHRSPTAPDNAPH